MKYSRWVLILSVAIVVLGVLIPLTTHYVDFDKIITANSYFPLDEQINRNWPRFRGPNGQGIVADTNVPQNWDGKTGLGILWETEVPLPGMSSPVVWQKRVFLSGADPNKQNVFCFDAVSGRLLWTGDVSVPPLKAGQKPLRLDDAMSAGYAAPTVTTDGQRVYAIFPTGVVGCFDFDGNKVWKKDLGRPDNAYGYACSLVMFQNLLLIQFDQGTTEEDQKSMMIAIDGATGNFAWQKKRPVRSSWATPIIINAADKNQLIACSTPWVIAYNPADGTELWRAKCLSGDIAASPIYADGIVVAIDMYNGFIAIRPDGSGDVSSTHIAWSAREITPERSSPISKDGLIFILLGDSNVVCFRSSDGKELWEQRMKSDFWASPSLAGDRLYLLSVTGEVYIIEAGTEYKELAKCELYEECYATPAFVDGHIYIRGAKHLYCIGE